MKELVLELTAHDIKVGDKCGYKAANVTEDTLFIVDNVPVGFYLKSVEGAMKQLLAIANKEFRSDAVPKAMMSRGPQGSKKDKLQRVKEGKVLVEQYSTVLGSMQPKPHMRRPYPSMSSVHQKNSAKQFIKAMMLLCRGAEPLMQKYLPEIYLKQKDVIKDNVPKQWRFSDLYTSSISNYNISAPYHRDTGNLKDTVNCIFTKRFDSTGGYLNVPDYDVTIECGDNSLLCYPAWRNVHGVTPIKIQSSEGYRNSLIFYPLKGFGD